MKKIISIVGLLISFITTANMPVFSQISPRSNILNISVKSEGQIDIACTIKIQKRLPNGQWETLKIHNFIGDGFRTAYYELQIGTTYRVVVEAEDRHGNSFRISGDPFNYSGGEVDQSFTFNFINARMLPIFLE